jgi:hypothetical protein
MKHEMNVLGIDIAKPRQDFLDVFAELARLTFGHISMRVWHGSAVQY